MLRWTVAVIECLVTVIGAVITVVVTEWVIITVIAVIYEFVIVDWL